MVIPHGMSTGSNSSVVRDVTFDAEMNCWICGAIADSAEHMIKRSDLQSLFGHISERHQLFRRVGHAPREKVQGLGSNKLKFRSCLCSHCNNARTQQHDLSWETLSTFLRNREPRIKVGSVVRLNSTFSRGLRKSMLGVHLYFVKLFGCLIAVNAIPIEIQPFVDAILQGSPHPKIHLSFLDVSSLHPRYPAAITPVETIKLQGHVVGAQWFYFVGPLAVHVIYGDAISNRGNHVHLWHPSSTAKSIVIDNYTVHR